MYEIKKVNVLSAAKLSAVISTAAYVLWALIITAIALMSSSYTRRNFFDSDLDDFTIWALVIGLVISVAAGFGGGALMAWIYNLVSSWIGGLKVKIILDEEDEEDEDEDDEED